MASEAELYRQFLIEQKGATPEQADAFLKEKGMSTETFGDKALQSAKNIGKASIEALPLAGSLAGGVLGSAAGPVGTVAGAGLGAGAGKSLENLLEKYFLDEEKTRAQVYGDPALESLIGASGEAGGAMLAKGISKGLQRGGESFYKTVFEPTNREVMKKGKRVMPSDIFFEGGFTGNADEAVNFAQELADKKIENVKSIMRMADDESMKRGVFADPTRIYAQVEQAAGKYGAQPMQDSQIIAQKFKEYADIEKALKTPKKVFSPEELAQYEAQKQKYLVDTKQYRAQMNRMRKAGATPEQDVLPGIYETGQTTINKEVEIPLIGKDKYITPETGDKTFQYKLFEMPESAQKISKEMANQIPIGETQMALQNISPDALKKAIGQIEGVGSPKGFQTEMLFSPIDKPIRPEMPTGTYRGVLPSELAQMKSTVYSQTPVNQFSILNDIGAGKELKRLEGKGMKQEVERLADLLVPDLAGTVRRENEIIGTLLSGQKSLSNEAAKQAKMATPKEVTGSFLAGSIANPSVLPFLIGKEAFKLGKFTGPVTKTGMGMFKAGKAVEDSMLDPVLKSLLIKQMQGE